jgi:Asp/Glu/hydantoin racemase
MAIDAPFSGSDETGILHSRELGGVAGYAVGVLHVASPFAFVPGNIQNATTMPFPISYECVSGVTLTDVLTGDSKVEEGLVSAARRLETRGVRAIVGACGSFANFQRTLKNAVNVPVCASVLVQVPWLLNCLPSHRSLGIIFADRRSFTPGMQEQCAIHTLEQLEITDCMDLAPFRALLERPYEVAHAALRLAITQHARSFVRQHPDIGMLMLQCSELPPYAAAIQVATGLPVVDVNTVVSWAHSVSVRYSYSGHL